MGSRTFPKIPENPNTRRGSGAAVLHLKFVPVNDDGGVEERAEERPVFGVERFIAELVEIESCAPEEKFVGNLLDADF
ncbi:MAG: hypothetical protein ACLUKN_11820 [Bacilli bacterium]